MTHSPKKKCSSESDINIPNTSGEQNVAIRKRKKPQSELAEAMSTLNADLKATLTDWRKDMNDNISKIADNVAVIQNNLSTLTQTTNEIKTEICNIRSEHTQLKQKLSELELKYNGFTQDIASLQDSVQFTDEQYKTINCRIDNLSKNMQHTTDLQNNISDLITKIDSLEQSARQCNIELCNVPEKKNEDLLSIIENIGTKINYTVRRQDIISIHRVPHAHRENTNPKNIVVKLTSRILRDNVLSAYRLTKNLTTEEIGISGSSHRIVMHEHLTLKNKHLFRECKEACKKYNYKFVWIKHGTIMVREKETTRAFPIRSKEDIIKIKPGHASTLSA